MKTSFKASKYALEDPAPGLGAEALAQVYQRAGCPEEEPPKRLTLDDKVLRFYAYFLESPNRPGPETDHVRKVEINYFPCDGTLMVNEPKIPDSGYLGGTILKRHKVPLNLETRKHQAQDVLRQMGGTTRIASEELVTEQYISLNHLNVGGDVMFYGRTYRIVDCDGATREFLEGLGVPVPAPQLYPDDKYYTEVRANLSRMEPRRKVTNEDREMKMGFEQMSGGKSLMFYPEQVSLAKRYLADNGEVLNFSAVWDDRGNPHGDLRRMEIKYFLCDDTVMVVEKLPTNCGRDPGRAVCTRRRLPKDAAAEANCYDLTFKRAGGYQTGTFIGTSDLGIGKCIKVNGCLLKMVDADAFTRNWYMNNMGMDLGQPVPVQTKPAVEYKPSKLPPHNGFGEESDSIGNCKNLLLKPPKKDLVKWHAMDGQVLRFTGKLYKSPSLDESDRRFMINFYLGDDTIQVIEQAERNSGRMAGRCLKRQKVKKYRGEGPGCYFQWDDLYVGAVVNLCHYVYEITGADETTVRFRYQRDRLPQGINENTVRQALVNWDIAVDDNLKVGTVLMDAHAHSAEPVYEFMTRFNADHQNDVLVRELLATISGDSERALQETMPCAGDSEEMLAAKQERSKLIMAMNAAKIVREAMQQRKMTNQDLHKLMSSMPSSRSDATGAFASNSVHSKINPYQFITGCREQLKVDLAPEQMEALVEHLFPGTIKGLSLMEFVTLMSKWENYGALPPVRPRSGNRS